GQRAGAGAAVLLAEAECEDAVLAEQLDGTPRELRVLVDPRGVRRDPAARQRAHGLDQHLLLLGLAMADAHVSISSSLAVVIVSNPSAVTAYMFSMPTAPRPGNTNFGSTAMTLPGSNGSSKPGASTGSSSISMPTPWPRKRTRCAPAPMKWSSRPASSAIASARSYRELAGVPGRISASTARRIETAQSWAVRRSASTRPTPNVRVWSANQPSWPPTRSA